MKRFALLLIVLLAMGITAGFAEDVLPTPSELPMPEGYTLLDGKTGAHTAIYLLRRPSGETVFAGFVQTEEGWTLTESTPLPEKTSLDAADPASGEAVLSIPVRTGSEARTYGTDMLVTVALTDDVWRVTQLTPDDRRLHLRDNGVFISGTEEMIWGDLTIETDVTKIDWAGLPSSEDEVIAGLDMAQWRVLEKAAPLCSTPDPGAARLGLYRDGTAVRILRQQGGWAKVAILGGAVTGWMQTDSMTDGATQLYCSEYAGWLNAWWLPSVEPAFDAPVSLYAAPGGTALAQCSRTLHILGSAGDGWFHAADMQYNADGYVQVADLPEEEPFVLAAVLFPDCAYQAGVVDDTAACFLVDKPDGTRVFMGCVHQEDGSWCITESTPLPAGAVCDDYHSGGGSFIIQAPDPSGALGWDGLPVWNEYVVYLQEDGRPGSRWLLETIFGGLAYEYIHFLPDSGGVMHNERGPCYGTCTLERDVTKIDWAGLPLSLEAALEYIADDWGAVADRAAVLYAEPGADAPLLRTYFYGTPVKLLSASGDWVQVAVGGGVTQGWMSLSALALGADQMITELASWTADFATNPSGFDAEDLPVSIAWDAPAAGFEDGTPLYAAPEGELLCESEYGFRVQLLSDLGNGWYHVWDEIERVDFYIRESDCTESPFARLNAP